MNIRRVLSVLLFATFGVFTSGCSTTVKNEKDTKQPIKYHVKSQTNTKQVSEKLADTWLSKGVDTTSIAEGKSIKDIAQRNSKVAISGSINKNKSVRQNKYKNKISVSNNVKPTYKAPSRIQSLSKFRQASLTGDYAQNNQTKSFVNMMVVKHGFDRNHLNYLFSRTKATSFLKRMAYADAYGNRKTKKIKLRAGRWNRYRGNFLTERTISQGVKFWRENRIALQRAEREYGVPQEYILGIIGVETRYGGNVGKNRAIDALSAMGFNNPRRGKYFRSELESYLLMTRKERLDPLKPMASYAGALGLSQFMPSNIKRFAVDHDRSGSVNLWTPADAIGSVANYFKKHGWRTGGTVAVKANSVNTKYRTLKTGFKSSHSLTRLKSRGVSAKSLGNITGKASLIKLNTYSGDELWLGGHNFYVITRYNHSTHYGMAVHQLAKAIKSRIGGRSNIIRQASNPADISEILLAMSE